MRPTGTHNDWPWPFKGISRRLTSFEAAPPRKWFGNAKVYLKVWRERAYLYPHPIPDQGEWWIGSYFAFAWRTKGRWYFRFMPFGRFDDLEDYYAILSFTIKRY